MSYILAFCLLLGTSAILKSQGLTSAQIDSLVHQTFESLPQAGIAVAVVKDGKVIHSKGYGVTSVETGQKVDEHTLFAIASNTKAFTAAALAILVDENKLSWDDKVVRYIPEFKMYDSYVTEHFTIRDLLTHRSGLGLGAGDLMIYPDGSDFTIQDVIKSFQFQKPVSEFRTRFDYDNLLYIVAGEVIKRVSGSAYTDFIQARILDPLGMNNSTPSFGTLVNENNLALPHSSQNRTLKKIDSYSHELTNAAGGIYSSANDMSKWLMLQLNNGRYGENPEKQLFSQTVQQEMWKPYTPISFKVVPDKRYRNHFVAYGLGWKIADYCGYITLSHGGGLPGMLSQTTIIPELNLGIVVLTNTQPGGLSHMTLSRAIMDSYLGVEKRDWITLADRALKSTKNNVDSVRVAVWKTVEKTMPKHINFNDYIGTYEDHWFGRVAIFEKGDKLWFQSLRSPKLTGQMFYYKATTFAIKWNYTDMPCDAFAAFNYDTEGKATSIKMKGISPNIDFSFDFQDLHLMRVD